MMKKSSYPWLLALTLSLYCSFCLAASKDSNLDKLFVLSGINQQVHQIPASMKAGFMQSLKQSSTLPEKTVAAMMASADKQLSPKVILTDMRALVDQALSNQELESLLQWYETDTGKRITQAEEKASQPDAYQAMMNQMPSLLAQQQRLDMALRMDKLTGSSDLMVKMQEATALAVFSAMAATMPAEQRPSLEAFHQKMQAMLPQIKANAQQLTQLTFVYTYRAIDDASLTRYEAFLNQPASKKFSQSATQGLHQGFEKIVNNWAKDIAQILVAR